MSSLVRSPDRFGHDLYPLLAVEGGQV